jgi:hypothetical protein
MDENGGTQQDAGSGTVKVARNVIPDANHVALTLHLPIFRVGILACRAESEPKQTCSMLPRPQSRERISSYMIVACWF